ncbi:Rrf2 family transcriptional regulator [Xinfangfangia sp. CPCC 101601]|uniref:Rrf2 family transcriptional regulator n=1 Tax=Pseudogemmobacter lacusdianii TaxID=3069608 RepID=A0ABU0VZL9_9RHOB|nr:Rrf2 family transcriptional regulator [Xinfangfangia sp. CPCC 101601]MDQ2067191.1 Rrf2 family transcriptional regulator [Xinfangfangia sp. CPCC 101601]
MRLTAFTDYGLRALMRIASDPSRGFSTAELADEFGLSRHHLAKIVQRLAQGGILSTRRGGGGGAMLAVPAGTLRLGAVVRLLEESGSGLVDCLTPGALACTVDGRCGLKSRLRRAEAAFMAELDRSTLADIALHPLEVEQ